MDLWMGRKASLRDDAGVGGRAPMPGIRALESPNAMAEGAFDKLWGAALITMGSLWTWERLDPTSFQATLSGHGSGMAQARFLATGLDWTHSSRVALKFPGWTDEATQSYHFGPF